MRLKSFSPDYISVFKYLALFSVFVLFLKLESTAYPYSIAIYACAMALNANIIITPILFISSFLALGEFGLLAAAGIPAALFMLISFLYKKFSVKSRLEYALYAAVSLTGYIVLGNTSIPSLLEKRLLVSLLITILTFVSIIGFSAITKKGLKFKLSYEEFTTVAILVSLLGLGLSNTVTPLLWKSISVALILFSAYIYKTGISSLFSCALGLSLALYYGNLNFVAMFILLALVAEGFMPVSRFLSALAVIFCEYLVQVVFKVYADYYLTDIIFTASGALIFCAVPKKALKHLKDRLYSFREKQLVRQSINRNRLLLSNRLYELSEVFSEIYSAFKSFEENKVSEDSAREHIKKTIAGSVCENCNNFQNCREKKVPKIADMDRVINIGFAKGKLSLIDLPKGITDHCLHPSDIIYGINKLLSEYRALILEEANVNSGRSLIASEAVGISDILKNLALESGSQLKYQSRAERYLSESLFKNGFTVSELLIYGEEENLSVGLILLMKEFSLERLNAVINASLNADMSLCDKSDISEEKVYLSFRRSPAYDAVFGVSSVKKDGSIKCGDTHSVSRIKEDKFLVALSDGMGSGEKAEKISGASLSLIESFYKAGLKSNLILNTVNKLLAINTEETFTALDVSIIDLNDCSADFIKYGSPIGFIIGKSGIKIIEGNSLPLGILEELKPSVCHANLSDGDIVLFLTDGVTDAFGSSSEIVEYLRTVPAFNPQTLADDVIKKALEYTDGKKNDDMTALSVRIFSRKNKYKSAI